MTTEYLLCKECEAIMEIDDSIMLTSMPPQFKYYCTKCDTVQYNTKVYPIYTEERDTSLEARVKRLEEIILNNFKLEEIPESEKVYDFSLKMDEFGYTKC